MYLRTTKRKNKDGSVVEYFQLAHNERHPDTRKPVAKIIHNFGRTDQLDREQLVRLCRSIARVCQLTVVDPYGDDQQDAKTVDGYLADGLKRSIPLLWHWLSISMIVSVPDLFGLLV